MFQTNQNAEIPSFNRRASDPGNPKFRKPALEGLLTPLQTALFLAVSIATVYRMAESLEIPCVKFRGNLRFEPKRLAAWLTKQRKFDLEDLDLDELSAGQTWKDEPRIENSQKTTGGK